MTDALTTGAPDFGRVHRAGGHLIVTPPTAMAPSTWRTIEQDLLLHAEATIVGPAELQVPTQHAHYLSDLLQRPWPAGRWPWDWSAAARSATVGASQIHQSVLALLAGAAPEPSDVRDLMNELAAVGFGRTLLPTQATAVTRLVQAQGGGNFSVPGSGKTTMTFAVYAALREQGVVDRMLVVAPQSAYEAWSEESRDCFDAGRRPSIEIAPRSPRRSTEVVVVNYERAAQGAMRAAVDGWSRGRRLLVVYDEAHRAKRGAAGEHGRGALDLSELAARRLVLTGTPMPNGVGDLAVMLELAWPGHGGLLASPHTPGADGAWVRITKDQLELEPAAVRVVPILLDDNHRRIYDAVAKQLADDPEALTERPDLARGAIARLIGAAANPALLGYEDSYAELAWGREQPGGERALIDLLRDLPAAAKPAKLLAAAALAKEHAENGQKLLVWTNFIGNVRELARLLEPFNPAVVTGALARDDPSAATDRVRQLRMFREDADSSVLIATPQTLGEGVSLHHACQSQVHVDRTFNAGLYLQSLDRTHRVGMPPGTSARVTLLVAAGTIDEAVDAALKRKLVDMDEKLRDPTLRRLAEPDIAGHGIGTAEIAELIAHLR